MAYRVSRQSASGAPAEPLIPFQPWAGALANYNSVNLSSSIRKDTVCLRRTSLNGDSFPMEVINFRMNRIIMIYEVEPIWFTWMKGRPHPHR